jgi:hypothetical protein
MVESSFWAQFWPNLGATFLGVFVGIAASLAVDRWREGRARRQREAEFRTALRGAVARNLELCEPLRNLDTGIGTVPSIHQLDVHLIDDVFPQLVEVSSDVPLLQALDEFRYRLREVNRSLDAWPRIEHENGWRQRPDLLDLRSRHIQLVARDANDLLEIARREPLARL